MHRFINSVASIEVNKALAVVQVNLNGYGSIEQYLEAFSLATRSAHLFQMNAYLLVKPHFEDITCCQFHHTVEGWLALLEQSFNRKSTDKTKIALLVDKKAFLEFSGMMHKAEQEIKTTYYHVCYDIFFASHKAYHFLKPITKIKSI